MVFLWLYTKIMTSHIQKTPVALYKNTSMKTGFTKREPLCDSFFFLSLYNPLFSDTMSVCFRDSLKPRADGSNLVQVNSALSHDA